MRSRFEVWRYSDSWNKWVRDIYRDPEEAQQRYEFLLRRGKKAKAPRPFNSRLPFVLRIGFAMHRAVKRTKTIVKNRSRRGC